MELFTLAKADTSDSHGLWQVDHIFSRGKPFGVVIPVNNIRRSVYLVPLFGPQPVPCHIKADNVLYHYNTFYIDYYSDRHAFHTMQ